MGMIDGLVGEFEHESEGTRKTLERVPDGAFDYKPHPKSMTMGHLASHIVEILYWGITTVNDPEFDIPPDYKPWQGKSAAELVARWDSEKAKFVSALKASNDGAMFQPWTLKSNGKVFMTMPRIAVLRGFIISHMIHHRAQLGVYLRMNNVPVPSIYGPSADEGKSAM